MISEIINEPVAIGSLSFESMPTVLVLAPHPDDFDAIGVTLRHLHSLGARLHVLVAMSGSGVEESYCPGASVDELAALRADEQRRSIRFFGLPDDALDICQLENDDTDQMTETPGNFEIIRQTMETLTPNIVFLPHRNDSNRAHCAMCSMFSRAVAGIGNPVSALLSRDPKTLDMRTDLYMPFDLNAGKWKAELLRFHDSQQQRNLNARGHGFDDRILQVNRWVARELDLDEPYAEAFELEKHNSTPEHF